MSLNAANTLHTAWSPWPPCYVRGQANTASLPVYVSGALVAPVSGTYTLEDPGGTDVVSAAAITVTGSMATYSLTSTHLPATAELNATYLETWVLTLTGSVAFRFERCVAVGRRDLRPVITDRDLTRLYAGLERDLPGNVTSFQIWIDEAWAELLSELIGAGVHPQRIVSPEALRRWHRELTLAMFFGSCAARAPNRANYLELQQRHQENAEKARGEARARFDSDDDGRADENGQLDATGGGAVHRGAAPIGPGAGRPGWW